MEDITEQEVVTAPDLEVVTNDVERSDEGGYAITPVQIVPVNAPAKKVAKKKIVKTAKAVKKIKAKPKTQPKPKKVNKVMKALKKAKVTKRAPSSKGSKKRGPHGPQWTRWKLPYQDTSMMGRLFKLALGKGGIKIKELIRLVKKWGGNPTRALKYLRSGHSKGWVWEVDDSHDRIRVSHWHIGNKKWKRE